MHKIIITNFNCIYYNEQQSSELVTTEFKTASQFEFNKFQTEDLAQSVLKINTQLVLFVKEKSDVNNFF